MEWVIFHKHGDLYDLIGDEGRQFAYNIPGIFFSNESLVGKEVSLHYKNRDVTKPYFKLREGKS